MIPDEGNPRRILIVKTGTTFPSVREAWGDFEDWVIAGMELGSDDVQIVSVYQDETLPDPDTFAGVVVTGSHSSVLDDEPWVERLVVWVRHTVDRRVPFLGICYGHQLLARAMGGKVDDHPEGREIGTARISMSGEGRADLLLSCLPDEFGGFEAHYQTVTSLPGGARTLASSDHDPRQAIRVGDRAWGVQFHPEFSVDITRGYIDNCADELVARGSDPKALKSEVVESPESRLLLSHFVELLRGEGFADFHRTQSDAS